MLRGPLTTGEVRARGGRLCEFSSLDEAETVLAGLCEREDGPYIRKLPRQPGRKEPRYVHLLCGEPDIASEPDEPTSSFGRSTSGASARLTALEEAIERMGVELERIRRLVEG